MPISLLFNIKLLFKKCGLKSEIFWLVGELEIKFKSSIVKPLVSVPIHNRLYNESYFKQLILLSDKPEFSSL